MFLTNIAKHRVLARQEARNMGFEVRIKVSEECAKGFSLKFYSTLK